MAGLERSLLTEHICLPVAIIWLLSCYNKDKIQGASCAKGRWNLFLPVDLIASISVAVFHQTKPQKTPLVYLGGDELCSPDECWHWIHSTKMCLDLQDRDYLAFAGSQRYLLSA